MRLFRVLSAAVLWGTAISGTAPIAAQPALPPPSTSISGRAVDSRTGRPNAQAAISIYWKGEQLGQARADAEGHFTLANLPKLQPDSVSFVLLAHAPGTAPVVMTVASDSDGPVAVRLRAANPLRVKITTLAGEALPGAQVTVPKVWVPNAPAYPPRLALGWTLTPPATTDTEGVVTLTGLPALIDVQLTVRKAGFADSIAVVTPSRLRETTVAMALENIIEGRLLLGEGNDRPLGVSAWRMKMQGWNFPWAEYKNWRMGDLDKQGRYVIRNVTSVDVLNEPTYAINLDLADNWKPQPGITAAYVPPKRGFNVLVIIEREGRSERWISYVEGQSQGMKLGEGEIVRHDMHLLPMALLQGTLDPAGDAKPRTISYHDPKSIYSDWQVTPGADGRFEITVPVGEVQLKVGTRTVTISGLKAHEVRTINLTELLAAAK